ncbi:MAG: Ku protein, partial [Bdellovibrionota bacterium]
MERGLWSGSISFGLVTIPVSVVSAENKQQELDFDLIDRRDHAHVGYQKINKNTGKPIESEDIVKGLKLETGKYALFEQDELKHLRIKGTSTIEIQQFVTRVEITPIYFKKFYYLQPAKNGDKTYVLLRETLLKTETFAVGLIVLHNRQQLVAIGAMESALILHVLHYPAEIKKLSALGLPAAGLKSARLTAKEISMAEKLVGELTETWKPIEFKDTYFR